MEKLTPARVRFAPSPTGHTHLGSGRTALYDYLIARQTGGQFILRIEDTDQKRYVPGSEEELISNLRWLGLEWDEGPDVGGPHAPYRQSERRDIYQHYARQLIERGQAFYCFCTPQRLEQVRQEQRAQKLNPRYDGACRRLDPDEAARRVANGERHVVRFKMPDSGSITVHDRLRGDIRVENRALDDSVLIKSDGLALYHLAAMVDDHEMNITHVIRGSEWLPTFPLHGHIIRAMGWQAPEFIHLSLFLKPSGKGKMSKRDASQAAQDGYSIFLGDLRTSGFVPEAVVNWIVLMGWSLDDHSEFFTLPDLIRAFSLDKCNPSPAAINFSKLDHFNGQHIRNFTIPELAKRIKPYFQSAGYTVDDDRLLQITPLIQPRLVTLDDCLAFASFFFKDNLALSLDQLVSDKMTPAESALALRQVYELLAPLPEISPELAEEPLRSLAEELGLKAGQLFGLLRMAMTGQAVSPPLIESMAVIGKTKALERLQNAISLLSARRG
jgi:glutamyl-tRNA synthetase